MTSPQAMLATATRSPELDSRHVACLLDGAIGDALGAQAIAAELDELPLPYRFDVKPFALIELRALRDHIERVGLPVYP